MRSTLNFALVALFSLAPLAAGCGGARSWPAVRTSVSPDFVSGAVPIGRIDVMPIDVDLAARGDFDLPPDELVRRFDNAAGAAVIAGLANAGYQANPVGWNGLAMLPDGSVSQVFLGPDLDQTAAAFAAYASFLDDPRVLGPALPVRLGAATGAEATLYVGGEAYVGKKKTSKAAQIGKVVLIGLAVIALVAIVVIVARDGGGGLGKVAEGAGRAAVNIAKTAGKGVELAARGAARVGNVAGRTAVRTLDAIGRSNVNLNVHVNVDVPLEGHGPAQVYTNDEPGAASASIAPAERMPRKGNSKSWITMVLVDNRSGRVIWHARQRVGVSPADHNGVSKLVTGMLAELPLRVR